MNSIFNMIIEKNPESKLENFETENNSSNKLESEKKISLKQGKKIQI